MSEKIECDRPKDPNDINKIVKVKYKELLQLEVKEQRFDFIESKNDALHSVNAQLRDSLKDAQRDTAQNICQQISDECERVLSLQTKLPSLQEQAIDTNLRMTAILLPDIITAIKERYQI